MEPADLHPAAADIAPGTKKQTGTASECPGSINFAGERLSVSSQTTMNLPDAFTEEMASTLGATETDRLVAALDSEPPVSIRLNPKKDVRPAGAAEGVPWSSTGYYLTARPAFTFDPLLHAGCYYVQEAASMFIEQAFRVLDTPPRRVLDLCAAPGGKSTLWRSLLADDCLLVANEPLRARAAILAENLLKWGHPNICVTSGYPSQFAPLTGFFDVVAADVPCSGEGMFRKDPAAIDEWQPGSPALCAARQRDIVADVWPALRTGGYLVYSTCTFNRAEDEDNVRWIADELGAEVVDLRATPSWGIAGSTYDDGLAVNHFFPHRTRGEGFFLALLRKTAEPPASTRRRKKTPRKPAATVPKSCREWLSGDFTFSLTEKGISALPAATADDMERVAETVRPVLLGVPLGTDKGRKFQPAPTLPLSTALRPDAFPRVGLDYADAIAYLRREAIVPSTAARGHCVVTYQDRALGFVNHLGARANNLYPVEWRIRSSHGPDTPPGVVEPNP